MSTKINITVDSGGLSARAKQQQEAARLAQLERERTRRTEAEAKSQRDAKQAAEGRRPDGQPQFGTPPQKPRPQDEPAAFRANLFDFGEGYFTVNRQQDRTAVFTVRSGDQQQSISYTLPNSAIPDGFRDAEGADKAPAITVPSGANIVDQRGSYYVRYTTSQNAFTLATHQFYELEADGSVSDNNAWHRNDAGGGWGQFDAPRSERLLILPVDSESAVFAYVQQQQAFKAYVLHTENYNYLPDKVFSEGTVDITEVSYTFTSPPAVSKAAFLVTRKRVKQIDYPEPLYDAAVDCGLFIPYVFTKETLTRPGMVSTFFVYDSEGNRLGHYTGTGDFFKSATKFQDYSGEQEIISWGLKQDISLREQAGVDRTSPGIYEVLQGASVSDYNYPPSFSSIKDAVSSKGKDVKWFRVQKTEVPNKYVAQTYTGDLPNFYVNGLFDAAKFKNTRLSKNRQILSPHPVDAYYRWTDWGNPAYCKQQLLSLGFTSADLTP